MVRTNFNGLVQLNNTISGLDTAQETKVWVGDEAEEVGVTDKYKAIWNLGTSTLSAVVSKKYKLVQHKDAFGEVTEIISGLNLGSNIFGFVNNNNDVVNLDILFDNKRFEVNGDSINLGVRFSNSYNKKMCLSGELFAYRGACSNGMVLGRVFKSLNFRKIHTGQINVEREITSFMNSVFSQEQKLKELVSNCMKDSYEWELAKVGIKRIIGRKKLREKLIEIIERNVNNGDITRWDIYNGLTNLATHGEQLKPSVETYLQNKAQKILTEELVCEVENESV